ncbi:MAG: methylglyoxal synthase [Deltaproteobacteria bacterium]|nr:methylglyoxal synthase [Deltaproteobacteria bacterium]MCL5791486.1 methylglyoxal synthase [Deltaproteobacteria bacterium]
MTKKTIALVAHDAKKTAIVEWAKYNEGTLKNYFLFATRSTGLEIKNSTNLDINLLLSGPHGGDAEIGAMIAEGKIDILIFLWDPLTPQPHDVDVKTLLRLAVLYNIPMACNKLTADFLISSPLFKQ